MKRILVPALILVLAILVCGCTFFSPASAPVTPQPSQEPTPVASVSPAPVMYPATPGPVQTVPDYESVSVTVNRNAVSTDPTITVVYNGGKGLGMTTRMDVTVVRSDGVVETGSRKNPGIGSSVTLMGTTGSDRVIVAVTMTSGDQYTIIDRYYPFPASLVPS